VYETPGCGGEHDLVSVVAVTEQLATPAGLAISYREWGRADGPVAVLLHGLTEDSSTWELVGPVLGQRFRVIAPDARGHGDSDWAEDYSFEAQRDDVVAVLDELGVLAAAVVGFSMGGLVAYLLAATHPDRVRALVLEDPPPPVPADPPRDIRSGPEPGDRTDWQAEQQVLLWRNHPEPGWADHADAIACQTLVVGGVRSHLPQGKIRQLTERIPRSRFVLLDTGHEVHGDRPGEFLAVVQPFLDDAIR
jgi:pimeloyl-ACP methyl ester carboxylesterase